MAATYEYPEGSASCAYEAMVTERSPYLQRAEDCAKLTIQSIMLPEGSSGSTPAGGQYQSVGGRGVNNLASKLLLALMPPNQSFFRCTITDAEKEKLTVDKEKWTLIEQALGKMETICQNSIEQRAIRVTLFELLIQIIICGNCLLHIPVKGPASIYNLRQYVVQRQHNGTILKIVVKEMVAKSALTENQKSCLLPSDLDPKYEKTEYGIHKSEVAVFTCIDRGETLWNVTQEIKGKVVPESAGTYPLDAPGFIAVRWRKCDGEHYGRSFVDGVFGDLTSLEGLYQSLVEAAGGMAKLLFMVNPNGTVTKEDLEGNNNDIIDGNEGDVTVLQANKAGDLTFAKELADGIEKRVELLFGLNTAVQRDAERVTAEEIRYVAQEIEDTHGGVYSIQSLEMQVPMINRVMNLETRAGNIPQMPKESLKVQIIAGLEALGRSHELARLDAFVTNISQTFGPEAVVKYINVLDYLTRRATALGIDTSSLMRTQADIDQATQDEQVTNIGNKVGPEIAKQIGAANAAGAGKPELAQPRG